MIAPRRASVTLVLLAAVLSVVTTVGRSHAQASVVANPRVLAVLARVGQFVLESIAQNEIASGIDRALGRDLEKDLKDMRLQLEEQTRREKESDAEQAARDQRTEELLQLVSRALASVQVILSTNPPPTPEELGWVRGQTKATLERLIAIQNEQAERLDEHERRLDQLELRQLADSLGPGDVEPKPARNVTPLEEGILYVPPRVTYLWAFLVPHDSNVGDPYGDMMTPEEFKATLPDLVREACTRGQRLIVTAQGTEEGEWLSQNLKVNGRQLPLAKYGEARGQRGGEIPLFCVSRGK